MTHHCCDRREVGWPAGGGVEDGRSLAEEVGAESAGRDDRKRLGIVIRAPALGADPTPRVAVGLGCGYATPVGTP